jgi:hypothetical protein
MFKINVRKGLSSYRLAWLQDLKSLEKCRVFPVVSGVFEENALVFPSGLLRLMAPPDGETISIGREWLCIPFSRRPKFSGLNSHED